MDEAKIVDCYNTYRTEFPELYNYTRTFYWILYSLMDAYRIANTGAFTKDAGHTQTIN